MPFSVRRVSEATIILEIVYLLRKRRFVSKIKIQKTYRVIIWPTRPLIKLNVEHTRTASNTRERRKTGGTEY